jgi:hypothetical protein
VGGGWFGNICRPHIQMTKWIYCGDANTHLLIDFDEAIAAVINSQGEWYFYDKATDFRSNGYENAEAAKLAHARFRQTYSTHHGFAGTDGRVVSGGRGSHSLKNRLADLEKAHAGGV